MVSEEDLMDMHASLNLGAVSYESYVDPGRFEIDKEKIFKKVWLNVGRVEEIPSPGYIVRRMDEWDTSIIINRNKNGKFSAFHNICTHRGNELVWSSEGTNTTYVCKFHGWAFKDSGGLIGVPESRMFPDLDKKKCGLKPVTVDVWNGFVFVHFDPNPSEGLREYLGEVADRLDAYPFEDFSLGYRYELPLNSTWRILRDSQLEGYHAKQLHKNSLPDFLKNPENNNIHVVEAGRLGRHGVVGLIGNKLAKPTATQAILAGKASFVAGRDTAFKNRNKALNPTKADNWSFDLYFVFPNFHVIVMDDMYLTHVMRANGPDNCTWEAVAAFPPATNGEEAFHREYAKCSIRDTWLEDGSTIERTYYGLKSGVLQEVHLQAQEFLIAHAEAECERMSAA